MPAEAIVCVRHLRIACPPPMGRPEDAHLQRRECGAYAQDVGPPRWTAAIGKRMDTLVRDTVRPFRQAVPADAPAVLFVDEAELLACLARDWQSGAGQAWWWRSIFGETLNDALVRRALLSAPTLVPAAIDRLARAHCGRRSAISSAPRSHRRSR